MSAKSKKSHANYAGAVLHKARPKASAAVWAQANRLLSCDIFLTRRAFTLPIAVPKGDLDAIEQSLLILTRVSQTRFSIRQNRMDPDV